MFSAFLRGRRARLDLGRPTITIEVGNEKLRGALNEVCRQAGRAWALDEMGDEGVLRFEWLP